MLLLAACTTAPAAGPVERSDVAEPAPVPAAAPPVAPPAACLLDIGRLAAATGVGWTADLGTASDARCVYDLTPAPSAALTAGGPDFLAVDVVPSAAADPAAELDVVSAVCVDVPVTAGAGFVCRLPGGAVFGASVRDGRLTTVAGAGVPPGTSPERLVAGVSEQLAVLR